MKRRIQPHELVPVSVLSANVRYFERAVERSARAAARLGALCAPSHASLQRIGRLSSRDFGDASALGCHARYLLEMRGRLALALAQRTAKLGRSA